MKSLLAKINRKLFKKSKATGDEYDFNASNPLGGNGERVDIQLHKQVDFSAMDVFQKNHWRRYEFAKETINEGDRCGDFACGTGYGSVLLVEKAKTVIGADIDAEVIAAIKERYKDQKNVQFLQGNLLNLDYTNCFDAIVSFETLEHFAEADIQKLLGIFYKALAANGRLIFSTPYMQEKSEEAMRMGFHQTFYIDESKIKKWIEENGFEIETINYQNYDTHSVSGYLKKKEFIICVVRKRNNA